jgi:hypothetical protein
MVKLGLEYLSVFGLEPVAFIHLARDLGLSSVGLNMRGAELSWRQTAELSLPPKWAPALFAIFRPHSIWPRRWIILILVY